MLEIDVILKTLSKEDYFDIEVEIGEEFDLNVKNSCFILKDGEVLAYGKNNFTHLLRNEDPIRISENIYGRENMLFYKRNSDISLIKFDGKKMRKEVNNCSALVKSIIKYSLNRICGLGTSKVPYYFEDEFLFKFDSELKRLRIDSGEILFNHGAPPSKMYFVESGSIKLSQESGNQIAIIGKGECFGESAILLGEKRKLTAEVIENSKIRTISKELIEEQIQKQTGLVQIAVFGVLRRLDFMNILRNPSKQNSEIN
tara:strand:- start:66 stop:836 length:771 start_codon:yes stop_codon:yes gene_type:complete